MSGGAGKPPLRSTAPRYTPSHHSGNGADVRVHYDFQETVGKGTFAVVHKAVHRRTKEIVAIKSVDKLLLDTETKALLKNELETMRLVSLHPGVPTLHRSYDDKHHTMFVMDYVPGGPLLDQIVKRRTFTENDARATFHSALRTLNFMAKIGVVHRDLKPENLLVDDLSAKWPIKISDFGFSAKIQTDELLYEAFGTPYYTAPEVIWRRGYSCACDVWSLGVVLYIVLFGFPPFAQTDNQALFRAIGRGKFSFPSGTRVSEDARDAVSRMLVVTPSERITASELLRHRWFTQRPAASSPLPTEELRSFNARRKVRGSFLGVTTTFHFWSLIGRPFFAARAAAGTVAAAGAAAASEPAKEDGPPRKDDAKEGPELLHSIPHVHVRPSGTLALPSGDLHGPVSTGDEAGASTTTYSSSVGPLLPVAPEPSGAAGSRSPVAGGSAGTPARAADQTTSTALVAPGSNVVAAPGVHHLSELLPGAEAVPGAAGAALTPPDHREGPVPRGSESALPPARATSASGSSDSSSTFAEDAGNTLGGGAKASEPGGHVPSPIRKQAHFAPDPDGSGARRTSGDESSDTDSIGSANDDFLAPPPSAPRPGRGGTGGGVSDDTPQPVLSRRRSLLLGEAAVGSPPHASPPPAQLDKELRSMLDHAETDGVDDVTCNPFFAASTTVTSDEVDPGTAEEGQKEDEDKTLDVRTLRRHRLSATGGARGVVPGRKSVSLPATPHAPTALTSIGRLVPSDTTPDGLVGGAAAAPDEAAPAPPPLEATGPPGGLVRPGTHRRSDILSAVRSEVQAVSAAPEATVMPPLPPPRRRRRLARLDLSNIP